MKAPSRIAPAPLLLAVLLLPSAAAAFCGLQYCPRPAHAGSGALPDWEVGARTRFVTFDIGGISGSYFTVTPRALRRTGHFALGAEVPVTRLDAVEPHVGLSNPLLIAQYTRRLSYGWGGEAGVQIELPFGDADHGLAGSHFLALPWVGVRGDLGESWYVSGQLGYGQAIGGHSHQSVDDGHDHVHVENLVFVNPHGDSEAHARAALGWTHGRSTLEGFARGQQDVEESVSYLRAGASWEWSLARFMALQVSGDLPVTAARRSDTEIGVNFRMGW